MKISRTKHITKKGVVKRNPKRSSIETRLKRAEKKIKVIEEKYSKMSVEELLRYIRNRPTEYKRDKNIKNRYWNLYARSEGYARGMEQMRKELKD